MSYTWFRRRKKRLVQYLEQRMTDFCLVLLESLQDCSLHRFPFTHILLLDLHELMSSILNNKKQNQSVSAAGFLFIFLVQWFGLF